MLIESKPIVYLDMDGVIADLFNHVAEIHDVEHYNHMSDEEWDQFFSKTDACELFANLPPFPNANEIIDLLVDTFGSYKILSSPLNFDRQGSIKGKQIWLAKHVDYPAAEWVFDHEKWKYAKQSNGTPNILIDDYRFNITKWREAGGIGVKFQNDENTLTELINMLRTIQYEAA